MQFRFIELKKFHKKLHELKTIIDKWIFFIKNAENLHVLPDNIDDEGLATAYQEAAQHNWTKQEFDEYIYAGIREQDIRGVTQKAVRIAVNEALQDKEKEFTRTSRSEGIPLALVSKITGLPIEEVQKMADQLP